MSNRAKMNFFGTYDYSAMLDRHFAVGFAHFVERTGTIEMLMVFYGLGEHHCN